MSNVEDNTQNSIKSESSGFSETLKNTKFVNLILEWYHKVHSDLSYTSQKCFSHAAATSTDSEPDDEPFPNLMLELHSQYWSQESQKPSQSKSQAVIANSQTQ